MNSREDWAIHSKHLPMLSSTGLGGFFSTFDPSGLPLYGIKLFNPDLAESTFHLQSMQIVTGDAVISRYDQARVIW
jgi:hypothetical protein